MTDDARTRPPVVVLGDVMVDVIATAAAPLVRGSDARATVRRHGGGAGGNVAAWLAELGVPVALLAAVGDDPEGHAALATLRAAGVDVRGVAVDRGLPTGTCVTLVEPGGERTFLPDRAANAVLTAETLPVGAFVPGGHLHLSAYALLDPGTPAATAAATALARAAATGMTVSVDPASSAPLRRLGAAAFLVAVAGVHTLLPNADELVALTGDQDVERAARGLVAAAGAAEVVVKLGADGALWTDGVHVARAAGPVLAGGPVDSTGAGDAFAAAWIAARRSGATPADALTAACAQGSRAAGQAGARP